jgi:hypothetical protein
MLGIIIVLCATLPAVCFFLAMLLDCPDLGNVGLGLFVLGFFLSMISALV